LLYSLLLIIALGIGFYTLGRWRKLPLTERKGFVQKAMLWFAAGVILLLVLTGRAPWLMGILAALLALAARAAQLLPYIAMFKKLMGSGTGEAKSNSSVSSSPRSAMSKEEAADILGVDVAASSEEVRLAHKKLIQKLHPDRGGSDALAKQINTAKDVLLG